MNVSTTTVKAYTESSKSVLKDFSGNLKTFEKKIERVGGGMYIKKSLHKTKSRAGRLKKTQFFLDFNERSFRAKKQQTTRLELWPKSK